jgi:hypothetical protein
VTPDIRKVVEQKAAIAALLPQAQPYGEQFVAAGIAEGRWSAKWAADWHIAKDEARRIATEAYRTRKSVKEVARKYGLTEAECGCEVAAAEQKEAA